MLSEVKEAFEAVLTALPHIRGVGYLVPITNSPSAVLTFDWKESQPHATGDIVISGYQYYLEFYFPLRNSTLANTMCEDTITALNDKLAADPTLNGVCESASAMNGGRAFDADGNWVKPMVVQFRVEEVMEEA